MKKITLVLLALLATSVSADTTYYRSETVWSRFEFNSENATTPQQVTYQIPTYQIREYVYQELTNCQPVTCANSNNGATGNWFNAFSMPRYQRGHYLAQAIKGIDEMLAQRIVDLGFLNGIPATWQAFQYEMINAQNALYRAGETFSFVQGVLDRYGFENAKNLGYYNETGCTVTTPYTCSVATKKIEESYLGKLPRNITVQVQNAVLLPIEKDVFEVSAGINPEKIGSDVFSSVNVYDEAKYLHDGKSNSTTVTFTAKERKAMPINSSFVKSGLFTRMSGSQYSFDLEFDSKFYEMLEPSTSFELSYTVCRDGVFTSCYEVIQPKTQVALAKKPALKIAIDGSRFVAGKKYVIVYNVRSIGSKYFTNSDSSQLVTKTIRH